MPLLFVGGSAHMDAYARELAERAPPGVIFTGPRYGAERDALLSHARCFVLASHLEGFPLAPLEAMAAGAPMLLSDIPPHREIVSGVAALEERIVPDGAWPNALKQVCEEDWAEGERVGARGRDHVRRHFSWDHNASRTLKVYERALGLS